MIVRRQQIMLAGVQRFLRRPALSLRDAPLQVALHAAAEGLLARAKRF